MSNMPSFRYSKASNYADTTRCTIHGNDEYAVRCLSKFPSLPSSPRGTGNNNILRCVVTVVNFCDCLLSDMDCAAWGQLGGG